MIWENTCKFIEATTVEQASNEKLSMGKARWFQVDYQHGINGQNQTNWNLLTRESKGRIRWNEDMVEMNEWSPLAQPDKIIAPMT